MTVIACLWMKSVWSLYCHLLWNCLKEFLHLFCWLLSSYCMAECISTVVWSKQKYTVQFVTIVQYSRRPHKKCRGRLGKMIECWDIRMKSINFIVESGLKGDTVPPAVALHEKNSMNVRKSCTLSSSSRWWESCSPWGIVCVESWWPNTAEESSWW